MKIERFEIAGLAQYSYVISSDGEAAVVDAIRDIDRYLDYAAAEGLRMTHVLETHIHADFAAGSTALVEATGAELALSGYDEEEIYCYAMAHRALRDGDSVRVGSGRIEALHTPGHTPEHISFLVFDGAGNEPMALLSGDFLFAGSVGRPDLLGDAAKDGLAREMYRSLHERIAGLADGLRVLPGHGAGSLCGAGMSDVAETTLGFERETNAMFRLEEDAFVAEILTSVPEMPAYYPRMKELNAKGAAILKEIPGGRGLAGEELLELFRGGRVVAVDVREAEAFAAGHVSGAIHLGAGANFSLWAGWLLDAKKRVVLVGDGGGEEESRRGLVRVGLEGAVGYLAGGMSAWKNAGLEMSRVARLSVEEVEGLGGEAVLVDVRSEKEWDGGHIAEARHVALGELMGSFDSLPRDRRMVTICGSGYRASVAASLLERAGFREVGWMEGGMGAWCGKERAVACI